MQKAEEREKKQSITIILLEQWIIKCGIWLKVLQKKVGSSVQYCTPWHSFEHMFGWDDTVFYRKETVAVGVMLA